MKPPRSIIQITKQNPIRSLVNTQFSTRSMPVAILLVMVLAYGLLLPWLGLYMDDWHHVYFAYNRGLTGLRELFLYDSRPLAYLFYWPFFNLLGYQPFIWQSFSILLRFLAVGCLWLCLKQLWLNHSRQVAWAVLLFAVYPIFKEQFISIAYSLHWLGYSLFAFSIWAMLKAIRLVKYFWFFTVLSLLTGMLHLFLLEYFVGLELARPIFLWIALSEQVGSLSSRVQSTFRRWLPFLIALSGFVIYRLFFLPRPIAGYERNQLVLLFDLMDRPLPAFIQFIQNAMQDTFEILVASWNRVFVPEILTITQPVRLLNLSVILFSTMILYWYLTRIKNNHKSELIDSTQAKSWNRPALLTGLALTVLGILPIWLTGQYITTDNPLWSNRYAMASLAGASLVTVSALEALITIERRRIIVFSLLVGLAIGWNFQVANSYRWSWTKQEQFYHQLSWRAPYLLPGTTLLSEGEIFPNMTEIETSFAISTLYAKTNTAFALDYFFFSLSRRFSDRIDELVSGMTLRYNSYYTVYRGQSQDSLVIVYEPEANQCLWVLTPQDQIFGGLPVITRQAAVLSNLNRIQLDSNKYRPLPTEIFGDPSTRDWCYFYEKADLARQYQDWHAIIELWQNASQEKVDPGNGFELLPFIEGFARMGEWQIAADLTKQAHVMTRQLPLRLCSLWNTLQIETNLSPARADAWQQIQAEINCSR